MKLKQWADGQGIAYMTAWRWFRDGKLPIPAYRTATGMILVEATRPVTTTLATYVYGRVSTYAKKDDLNRQVERCAEFCLSNGWQVARVVKEVASGMNDHRPKLNKLLALPPGRLVVMHKDRLTRFGFGYFEQLMPKLGWELVVINRDADDRDDLLKDLVAIITSFCCRLYGLRRGKPKAKNIRQAVLCDAP